MQKNKNSNVFHIFHIFPYLEDPLEGKNYLKWLLMINFFNCLALLLALQQLLLIINLFLTHEK